MCTIIIFLFVLPVVVNLLNFHILPFFLVCLFDCFFVNYFASCFVKLIVMSCLNDFNK